MNPKDLINILRDPTSTTTEKGNAFEDFVLYYVNEKYTCKLSKTKRSGGTYGDGDLICDMAAFDCKACYRTSSITITNTELKKISIQAAKMARLGAILSPISSNDTVTVYATLSLDSLIHLIEGYKKPNKDIL